jgi:prepilin-type N-terminal cleavage/methylation domain-containing protein
MRSKGFTSIELLIVLAIVTIAFAIPALYSYFNYQSVGLAADRLRGDLQLARIMAINRKKTCAIVLNHSAPQGYVNSLSQQIVDFSGYRGKVDFMLQGPDGRKAASRIAFNRMGRSTSAADVNVYLADGTATKIYRIRVAGMGGITVMRWNGTHWN